MRWLKSDKLADTGTILDEDGMFLIPASRVKQGTNGQTRTGMRTMILGPVKER